MSYERWLCRVRCIMENDMGNGQWLQLVGEPAHGVWFFLAPTPANKKAGTPTPVLVPYHHTSTVKKNSENF